MGTRCLNVSYPTTNGPASDLTFCSQGVRCSAAFDSAYLKAHALTGDANMRRLPRAWVDGGMLDAAAQLMHCRCLVGGRVDVDRAYTGVCAAELAPMHPVASRGLLRNRTATAVRATARNATTTAAAFSDRNSPRGAPSAYQPTQVVISRAKRTTRRRSVPRYGQSGVLVSPQRWFRSNVQLMGKLMVYPRRDIPADGPDTTLSTPAPKRQTAPRTADVVL